MTFGIMTLGMLSLFEILSINGSMESRYGECHVFIMMSVIKWSVILLNVSMFIAIMVSVVMLNVVALLSANIESGNL
jgi:hypothetical protein